ncbi:zinc finger and BTB domain-containing protein 10 [Astyanax mexicanus]|uniref:Zinc finger and BTB domain-containing protein 10 n=2 Tax=Astyanax mexicanus TaxID=7994 RepID=A0A8B9JPI8_ASTMX|nr:zinc finger and BTB domain-containing protein 10 [Astyanax mexicanus]KAG9279728.1 zinc finger and BTB domain-containing protein 10 [Astyanax mexicanus]
MSGERNRRSLAFRGGGSAVTGSSGVRGSNGNSWEAQAWQDRHLNGNRPDQEEDRDLGAKGPSPGKVEGGGSVSDSTEPEAEEEEDPEGGRWTVGKGVDSIGWTANANVAGEEGESWTTGNGVNSEDGAGSGAATGSEDDRDRGEAGSGGDREEAGARKPWVEMRPQTLLQKHSLFQASWLQEFPWLKFNRESGLMSCSWCHNIATNNSDELVKGSRNYKRALLLRHHLSSEHGRNDPTKQETERPEGAEGTEVDDYRSKPNENSYCYQLLQELDKQRKSGILCDVNIVVGGQVFRAHKNILVAGSRYFKTLYCLTKSESCDQTTITHLDVAAVQGFSVILDFLYSGNLLLTSQNAIEVMSVASYLQMTEVVQSCRAFIKDALNISIKQEAPDSVVVDYNKRRTVPKDSLGADKKPSNFWATSILSKLSIKASGQVKEEPSDVDVSAGEGCALGSSGWGGDNSSESTETEPQGPGPVFVWNEPAPGTGAAVKREERPEPGSGRRKKQIARRFVYNIPPEPEEGFDEGMFIQPSASFTREDYSYLSENAGETSDTALNKLKCPHCNYIAKHRRTLKRHLIIHSGVRSFSCDICGKLFTRREHVKRHSLVHKKDKKYKCMVCKKIFMLAASVGIRHGSRRYGVCVDCADSHQATQGLEGMQELEFARDDDFEETAEGDEDMVEEGDGEEPNEIDQSNWEGDTGATPEED